MQRKLTIAEHQQLNWWMLNCDGIKYDVPYWVLQKAWEHRCKKRFQQKFPAGYPETDFQLYHRAWTTLPCLWKASVENPYRDKWKQINPSWFDRPHEEILEPRVDWDEYQDIIIATRDELILSGYKMNVSKLPYTQELHLWYQMFKERSGDDSTLRAFWITVVSSSKEGQEKGGLPRRKNRKHAPTFKG